MPNSPSPDETRETCRKLLDSPELRAACHYCGQRAEQSGTLATFSAGWDTRTGPEGVAWWRCPTCRAEDERPREVLVIPVRVEREPGLWERLRELLADAYLLGSVLGLRLVIWAIWRR